MKKPISSHKTLVPNIAHMVWLGGGYMDFLFYLCVLSLLNVAKVEAVYLHGDGPPSGEYWELIKNHEKLHLIHREHPGSVFGTPVNVCQGHHFDTFAFVYFMFNVVIYLLVQAVVLFRSNFL